MCFQGLPGSQTELELNDKTKDQAVDQVGHKGRRPMGEGIHGKTSPQSITVIQAGSHFTDKQTGS